MDGEVSKKLTLTPQGDVLATTSKNIVYMLDAKTGNKRWGEKAESFILGTPVSDEEGRVYFGCSRKKVYALKDPYTEAVKSIPHSPQKEVKLKIEKKGHVVTIGKVKLPIKRFKKKL